MWNIKCVCVYVCVCVCVCTCVLRVCARARADPTVTMFVSGAEFGFPRVDNVM